MLKEWLAVNAEKIAEDKKEFISLSSANVRKQAGEMREKLLKCREEATADWDISKVAAVSGNDDEAKAKEIISLHSKLCAAQDVLRDRAAIEANTQERAEGEEHNLLPVDPTAETEEPPDERSLMERANAVLEENNAPLLGSRGVAGNNLNVQMTMTEKEISATLFQRNPGWQPRDPRTGELIYKPLPRLTFLDIIRRQTVDVDSYIYMEETTANPPADMGVAEGASAGEFELQVDQKSVDLHKRGGILIVTDEVMEQRESTSEYINFRLPELAREDIIKQCIGGNGSGSNLEGILSKSEVNDIVVKADMSDAIDMFATAILKPEEVAERPATDVFIHPTALRHVYLKKDANGNYIMGHPSTAMPMAILGIPLHSNKLGFSYALDNTIGLAGDFVMGAKLVVHQNYSVEAGSIQIEQGLIGDQFKQWKRTLRLGIRCAMVNFRSLSFSEIKVASSGNLAA